MWYDLNRTLSYNKLFNFIVGPRGVGKTYGLKRRAIRKFLSDGKQFVYIRRYETELEKGMLEKFFDDIYSEFPEEEFKVSKGTFYINGMEAGYYIPLSKSAQYKSVPFPKVDLIIFDEFIIDQGLIRYLPREVQTFLELYSTIARLRDVTVFFLSNSITFTNPYFLYFDLKMGDKDITTKGDILLQVVENPEYSAQADETRFGKLIRGTEYGNYAVNNKFLRDTDTFIEKLPGAAVCLFVIRIDKVNYGVYSTIDNHNYYCSESYDPTCKYIIAIDTDSHEADTSLSKEQGAALWFKTLKSKYYKAEVRFTTMKVKNLITEAIRKG